MDGDSQNNWTITIGTRELIFGMVALLVVITIIVVVALSGRSNGETAQVTSTGAVLVTATQVPSSPTSTPMTSPTPQVTIPAEPTASSFEHEVQSGESLTSIAAIYGLTLNELLTANGLTVDSVIQAGQTLIIPLPPDRAGVWHEVQPGEALIGIAQRYGISVETIRQANGLSDDAVIFSGQRLRIPGVPPRSPTPDAAPDQPGADVSAYTLDELPTRPYRSNWARSVLEGDLAENYPEISEQDRFTIHYQPDTYAAQHLTETIALVDEALKRVEARLDVRLQEHFDVYVAGTPFAAPNAHLRGLSVSAERRVFILHDGTGTPADNAYFFTHELTHLVTWNTWGTPGAAFILSEGVATYTGRPVLEGGGYLDYADLCASISAADTLPSMVAIKGDWQAFLGHIHNPVNYFASGCFVSYLVDTYGLDSLRDVYTTSDYEAVMGRSLSWLDSEWQEAVASQAETPPIDPAQFNTMLEELSAMYRFVFNNYDGTATMHQAYVASDQARVALWQGNLSDAQRWLQTAYDLIGYEP